MNSKLDVTVAMDMDSGTTTITAVRELTLRNVHGLVPVARSAESLRHPLPRIRRTAPPMGVAA